ncbi:MAG: photosynthetic reaction center subunit H [Hyphomicrobiales bacterium]|jgi:photosynthetic reaction center H subunit
MDFTQFDFVNLTTHLDLAQVLLYGFWLFFGYLLFYLQKETRREGYPLESDETGNVYEHGIYMPGPKTFRLPHGHGSVTVPNYEREARELALRPSEPWSGAPKDPTGGNPMLDGVGPGAYALRADVPDLLHSGAVKIRPMRMLEAFAIPDGDPNPIGNPVVGCDKQIGGTVVDVWIDQAESVIRYYEIKVSDEEGARTVLMPANFAVVKTRPNLRLYVHAIKGEHFADVPLTANPDQITMLEEEKIMGYYGAGYFYATPHRADPLL